MTTDRYQLPAGDPLKAAWEAESHADDWGVPCVYEYGFVDLLTGELDRIADEIDAAADEMLADTASDSTSLMAIKGGSCGGQHAAAKRLRARAAELRAQHAATEVQS